MSVRSYTQVTVQTLFSSLLVNGTYIGTVRCTLCLVGIVEYLGELFSPP